MWGAETGSQCFDPGAPASLNQACPLQLQLTPVLADSSLDQRSTGAPPAAAPPLPPPPLPPAHQPTALQLPPLALPSLQHGIVGEMREAGAKMADTLAAAGEKLGIGKQA